MKIYTLHFVETDDRFKEIIEVGIAVVGRTEVGIEWYRPETASWIIKPERGTLSKRLALETGLSEVVLEGGMLREEFLAALNRMIREKNIWATWGQTPALPLPYSQFLDIRTLYAAATLGTLDVSLPDAVQELGLRWLGRKDRAADIALNLARLTYRLLHEHNVIGGQREVD